MFDSPRTIVENTYQRTLSVAQQEWIKRVVNGAYAIPVSIRVHERHQVVAELYMPYSGNWHVGICNRNGYVPDMYHRDALYWLRETLAKPPLMDLREVIVMDGQPDYQQLYTLGYTGLKLDDLQAAAKLHNWLVLDIRMSPHSRASQWNKNNLQYALRGERQSEHYIHLDALGNVNYRNGEAIKLKDPDFGLLLLLRKLAHQPVVLLCACAEVATCHRQTVAELVTARTGLQPIHLTPEAVKKLSQPAPAPGETTMQFGLPGFGDDRIIQ